MLARRLARGASTRAFAALCLLVLLFSTSGCAAKRKVMDMRADVPANPATGPAIVLRDLVDQRPFTLEPDKATAPSVRSEEDLASPEVRARAIGRYYNLFGSPLTEIFLPEDRTVMDLAREIVTSAFVRAGYRVLGPSDPGSESATPVDVAILEMWTWIEPGTWVVTNGFQGRMSIRGAVGPFANGAEVEGHGAIKSPVSGFGMWEGSIKIGIESIVKDVATKLGAAPAP
jgi:hypothetical protein